MIHKTPDFLLAKTDYNKPVIALYDAPGSTKFKEITELKKEGHVCLFVHYKNWMNGKTLKMTSKNFGCGGCGTWLFNIKGRSRQSYIEFLADDEGLKANHQLMGDWFDQAPRYQPVHDAIFAGPLNPDFSEFVKSVTFFVNPDQLSVFMLAANYFASPDDPDPVIAPFGSGCMEMLPLFRNSDKPKAIIGATDLAMRKYLPPEIMAFTVNMPLFEQLCQLGENSFLSKPFLEGLKKARKGRLDSD
jgi:hypothetical protein